MIIILIIVLIIESIVFFCILTTTEKEKKIIKEENWKNRENVNVLNKWIALKNNKKKLSSFFEQRDIKSIAIYGMNAIGCNLCDELEEQGINVEYGIDRLVKDTYESIDVVSVEKVPLMPQVDAIVIAITYYFDEMESKIHKVTDIPVYSLNDVLNDII